MVNPGAIKGWKRHRAMTCNFVVPSGKIKVVIYDDRVNIFEEIVLSPNNYIRLTIPPMVWVGFQGLNENPSLLLNIASIIHDPAEAENKDINTIAYNWSVKK
jgi:dTDP-4-dehydrorhamnose 3,5-epimerase